jgi:glucose-1-phosphate cytidylyltransferase
MKVVILAGGLGTRLSEETVLKPKPMVEIGSSAKPILWHIMKIYSHFGFNDFIICLGYKGYLIKEYFINYFYHQANLTVDLSKNSIDIHSNEAEPWRITMLETGLHTMTGGRIKQCAPYIGNESFMCTYGDGVGDVDIRKLVEFHQSHGKMMTVTSVQPTGRFGAMDLGANHEVKAFVEKPKGDKIWINAGFFVMQPEIFNYIDGLDTVFEKQPMERITEMGQMMAYKHEGFWKPMDTLRDKYELEKEWDNGTAPWKVWK